MNTYIYAFSLLILSQSLFAHNYTSCINECEEKFHEGQNIVEDMIYKQSYTINDNAVQEKSKLIDENYKKCLQNCEKLKEKK